LPGGGGRRRGAHLSRAGGHPAQALREGSPVHALRPRLPGAAPDRGHRALTGHSAGRPAPEAIGDERDRLAGSSEAPTGAVAGATRFNLSLPNRGVLLGFLTAEELLDAAARAEASGHFGGISVGDNLLEKPRLEVIALLGALTARTRHVRLNVGCLSTFILRDPILFAIQWASLDRLSGGRMELSVCIGGGDDREMVPYRMNRRERVPRLLETLAVVRRLWTEDHVSVAGRVPPV